MRNKISLVLIIFTALCTCQLLSGIILAWQVDDDPVYVKSIPEIDHAYRYPAGTAVNSKSEIYVSQQLDWGNGIHNIMKLNSDLRLAKMPGYDRSREPRKPNDVFNEPLVTAIEESIIFIYHWYRD